MLFSLRLFTALMLLALSTQHALAADKPPTYLKDPRGITFSIPSLSNQDPYSRLQRSSSRDTAGADNVLVGKVDFEQWPEYLKKQLTIAATECVDGEAAITDLDVFAYVTDYTRKNSFSPHFLVDFTNWGDKKFKRCHLNLICDKQDCALMAYTSVDRGQWVPSQPILSHSWSIVLPRGEQFHAQEDFKDLPQIDHGALFLVRSVGQPCEQMASSEEGKTGCFFAYSWDNDGMTIVSQ